MTNQPSIIEEIAAWQPENPEDPWLDLTFFVQSALTDEQIEDGHAMAGALSAAFVQLVAGDPEYAATIARQHLARLDPAHPADLAERFAAAYRGRYEVVALDQT